METPSGMDPLTHTATGIFLSRAGLKRWTPQATAILILAANAPDIDIVTASRGSLNYLHYHRHLTHALIAMPVMAILPVLLVRAISRKPVRWLGAFLAALLAVGSHLLLDFTNVYGIRLLLPFSDAWQRLDLTGVVDLWIWLALLLGFAIPALSRLVSSEITSGGARKVQHGRASAICALAFLVLYNGGRAVLHARAVASLESWTYQGEIPQRVLAVPGLNPLHWRGVIETAEFYQSSDIDLAAAFNPVRGTLFYKPAPDPAIAAARQTPAFRTFLNVDQFPLWTVKPLRDPGDGKQVDLLDLRFGTPAQPGFMTSAIVDNRNRVLSSSFQFGPQPPR
jgi:inner membrane protein